MSRAKFRLNRGVVVSKVRKALQAVGYNWSPKWIYGIVRHAPGGEDSGNALKWQLQWTRKPNPPSS